MLQRSSTMAHAVTTIAGSPKSAPRLNVVLLHGYSMTAANLSPFAHSLGMTALFHFPEASTACADGGLCWWPLDAEGRRGRRGEPRDLADAHPPGRDEARAALHETLCLIAARWPDLPLVLGGFSQGAMLSCDYLLQHDAVPLAGLVLMSGSRLAFDEWEPRLARVKDLPTFVSHGTRDDDLSFDAGLALEAALRQAGARTEWLPFDGGHEVPLVVWRRLKKFLLALSSAP